MARVLLLAALVAGLYAWDAALAGRRLAARAAAVAIGTVVPPSAWEGRPVAAVRLQRGAGESWFCVRREGLWRVANAAGALVEGRALETLMGDVLRAEGFVVSADPADPGAYGLAEDVAWRVTLHGPGASQLDPKADVLASVEVGRAYGAGAGTFLRRAGERAVWAVDGRPGALLAEHGDRAGPPLLDRALVPAHWPGTTPRVQRLRLERAGAPTFELVLRVRPGSDAEMLTGLAPWEWVTQVDGVERPCAQALVSFYVSWLLEQRWERLSDPLLAARAGFQPPRARLTLTSTQADPLQLVLGGALPGGGPLLHIALTGAYAEITPTQVDKLFPDISAFAPDAPDNPWDR